ncbi:MAG: hypothetical protein JWN34_6218 [Bryobacterales bacterium]|nr:hypothetical protein [Bryobacterales bacterium]
MPRRRVSDEPTVKTLFNFPRPLLKKFRRRCLDLDNMPQSEGFIQAVTGWLSATTNEAVPPQSETQGTIPGQALGSDKNLSAQEVSSISAALHILRSPHELARRILKGALDAARELLGPFGRFGESHVSQASENDTAAAPSYRPVARDHDNAESAAAVVPTEELRRLAENIREVLWITNGAGTELQYVSQAYEEIWGQPCDTVLARSESWIHALHPEDYFAAEEIFRRQLRGETLENEYRIVQPAGAIRWIRDRAFPVRDASGTIIRIAGIAEDITERKRSETRLLRRALYDELTGLPNRNLLAERTAWTIGQCKGEQFGALFVIDLDEFTMINDILGHAVGDEVIKEAARRLLDVTPESGILARVGGDEFTLIAPTLDTRGAVAVLGEKLLRSLDGLAKIAGHDVSMSASIGVCTFPDQGTNWDELKRNADLAMHEAKRAGRNQVKVFSRSYADTLREGQELERRLRTALELSQFKMQFQPEFAVDGSGLRRFEALLRWHRSDGSPISPSKFIPIAERTGMIIPIGNWVLHEACQRCVGWQAGRLKGVGVAVNVSAIQFTSPDFFDTVVRTLERTGLPPKLLELELTESVLLQDARTSAATLAELRNLGVTIALDDFGTGYSSLSYLQGLPLDALKIDRSLLIAAENRPQGAAVLEGLVRLAHTLGLRVIGEGVETQAQLDLLGELGCDELQGFFLGKPSFHAGAASAHSLRLVDSRANSSAETDRDHPTIH